MLIRAKSRFAGTAALCLIAGIPLSAQATEGYFALAYGTAQRGVAGAGVAFSQDAMSGAINPASVATVGRELNFGLEVFSPRRGYVGTGTAMVAPGSVTSTNEYFPVPNFAYNMPLDNGGVLNIAAYGNGGMNTSYPAVVRQCPSYDSNGDFVGMVDGTGVFCGGEAGVDLTQLFVSVGYAKKDGAFSWGIAPTFAVQRFAAKGLAAFGGGSVNAAALTNNGYDYSTGFGLRAGVQVELSPQVTLGLSGQTKFNMTKFDKYAGLFPNGGEFDIPASVTAGVALKLRPDLTLLADYQKIFYSDVAAVGNATTPGALGAPGGAGFGWDDVDVIRLAAEWQQTPDMAWRVGYAHATNPVGPEDVTLNILAPGVVEDHFSIGGSKKLSDRDVLDFSVSYVAPHSVTGEEVLMGTPTPDSAIDLKMHQISAAIGWTRKF